jgi:hypothetical protein
MALAAQVRADAVLLADRCALFFSLSIQIVPAFVVHHGFGSIRLCWLFGTLPIIQRHRENNRPALGQGDFIQKEKS